MSWINKKIGERIRDLRLREGMTQMQLAERIGITYQQVQKYEKGTSNISVERLYQIADALGVHPGSLLPEVLPTQRLCEEPTVREETTGYGLLLPVEEDEKKVLELFRKVKSHELKKALMALLEELSSYR